METRPVANPATQNAGASPRGNEIGMPPTLPAARPAVDMVAITQRDDFLVELGEALSGQAVIQPVDSVAAAVQHLAGSKRGKVLVIDTRDSPDVRAEVEQALAEAPNTVTILFATAEAENGVTAAIKGLSVQAVLPIPIDQRRTSLALDAAFTEAIARRPPPTPNPGPTPTVRRTPEPPVIAPLVSAPAAPSPLGFELVRPRPQGPLERWLIAAIGVVVVGGALGWWFLGRSTASTGQPAPAAAASSSPSAAVGAQVVETTVLQGAIDNLLEKARLAMRERRFTQPQGDNALLYYRSALAKDPTNAEAKDGLQRVATVLIERFEEAMGGGHYDQAVLALAHLKLAVPHDPRLAGLQLRVSAEQISRALAAGDLTRASNLVREAQQSGLVPDTQLALWRGDIARRQSDTRITQLAGLVTDSIREDQLIDPPDHNAKDYVAQLRNLAPTSVVTQRAVHDLNAALLRKAAQAALAGNSAETDRWLQEARHDGAATADIQNVEHQLAAQRQKTNEISRSLALFRQRLDSGELSAPAQDSAVYYLGQLQAVDPSNPQITTDSHQLAEKLLARARSSIALGKTAPAAADIALARRYGADPSEVNAVVQLEASRTAPPPPRSAAPLVASAAPRASNSASASSSAPTPMPKLIRYVAPDFPAKALAENLGGSVTVAFTIDVNGNPRNVHVVDASPPGMFDRAAVLAVKRWRYEPTVINGKPVEVPVETPIRFTPPQ